MELFSDNTKINGNISFSLTIFFVSFYQYYRKIVSKILIIVFKIKIKLILFFWMLYWWFYKIIHLYVHTLRRRRFICAHEYINTINILIPGSVVSPTTNPRMSI